MPRHDARETLRADGRRGQGALSRRPPELPPGWRGHRATSRHGAGRAPPPAPRPAGRGSRARRPSPSQLEHERVQDERDVAPVAAVQPLEVGLEVGDELRRLAGRAEVGQHAARIDVAPFETEQGEAVLDAGARAGGGAIAKAAPRAGRRCRRRRAAPPGGRMPRTSSPSSSNAAMPRARFSACAPAVSSSPLLVAPGVVGDLMAGRVDRGKQLRDRSLCSTPRRRMSPPGRARRAPRGSREARGSRWGDRRAGRRPRAPRARFRRPRRGCRS